MKRFRGGRRRLGANTKQLEQRPGDAIAAVREAHLVLRPPPAPPKNGWSSSQELVLGSARAQSAPSRSPGPLRPGQNHDAVESPISPGEGKSASLGPHSASAAAASRCARSPRISAGPVGQSSARQGQAAGHRFEQSTWGSLVAGAQQRTGRLGRTSSPRLAGFAGEHQPLLQLGRHPHAVRAGAATWSTVIPPAVRSPRITKAPAGVVGPRSAQRRPPAGRSPLIGIWVPTAQQPRPGGIEPARGRGGLEARPRGQATAIGQAGRSGGPPCRLSQVAEIASV